jgi:hypothetical protein
VRDPAYELNYWDGRAEEQALKEQAGKGGRLNSGNARAYAQTLTERLDPRLRQLVEERDIQALPPQVKGAALVVPIGLLRPKTGQASAGSAEDALARAEVERLAMQAVFAAEARWAETRLTCRPQRSVTISKAATPPPDTYIS